MIPERPASAHAVAERPLIRRQWSAAEAQEWTREDWIAIILSPLVFAFLLFGMTDMLLLRSSGLWMLLAASAGMLMIYWVIDPKLRATSAEYESQQGRYLADLERRTRWEPEADEVTPERES